MQEDEDGRFFYSEYCFYDEETQEPQDAAWERACEISEECEKIGIVFDSSSSRSNQCSGEFLLKE